MEGPVVVEAVIDLADPAQRDACVAATVGLQEATRRAEPGCLAYSFAADPVVDGRIQVYELWQDTDALAAHFQHPNYHGMRAALRQFGLARALSRKHLVTRSAPVYGADGRPDAAFS